MSNSIKKKVTLSREFVDFVTDKDCETFKVNEVTFIREDKVREIVDIQAVHLDRMVKSVEILLRAKPLTEAEEHVIRCAVVEMKQAMTKIINL